LKFLVELVIEKLTTDILAEGDFYPGDLLMNLLKIERNYWEGNQNQWQVIDKLIKENQDKIQQAGLNVGVFYNL